LPGSPIKLTWNDFCKSLEKDVVPVLHHGGTDGGRGQSACEKLTTGEKNALIFPL
jgi:hypothetical protein